MNEVLIELDIEELEEGGYLATSKVLPGLVAQGRTIAETMEIAEDVARKLVESYIQHGDPLPFPLPTVKQGATTLRVPVAVGK
ncbi:MAG: type II toxin-antitoxin system HicB family antitoxin [Armatimonadetes bacterium]|nr:type II toxin-antitoxin system HicB family antitoxin [Armatimonadota bacterium]